MCTKAVGSHEFFLLSFLISAHHCQLHSALMLSVFGSHFPERRSSIIKPFANWRVPRSWKLGQRAGPSTRCNARQCATHACCSVLRCRGGATPQNPRCDLRLLKAAIHSKCSPNPSSQSAGADVLRSEDATWLGSVCRSWLQSPFCSCSRLFRRPRGSQRPAQQRKRGGICSRFAPTGATDSRMLTASASRSCWMAGQAAGCSATLASMLVLPQCATSTSRRRRCTSSPADASSSVPRSAICPLITIVQLSPGNIWR